MGIYAIVCVITGAIYLGSSMDLGSRLIDHLFEGVTNFHLQNAITFYGLDSFVFHVIEFVKDVSSLCFLCVNNITLTCYSPALAAPSSYLQFCEKC